jgi:hypothetical protein
MRTNYLASPFTRPQFIIFIYLFLRLVYAKEKLLLVHGVPSCYGCRRRLQDLECSSKYTKQQSLNHFPGLRLGGALTTPYIERKLSYYEILNKVSDLS